MCSGLNIVSRITQKYTTLNPKEGKKENTIPLITAISKYSKVIEVRSNIKNLFQMFNEIKNTKEEGFHKTNWKIMIKIQVPNKTSTFFVP